MGQNGGARPGAGRPKGSAKPLAKTQELVRLYREDGKELPVDVLLKDMRFYYDLSQEKLPQLFADELTPKEKARIFRAIDSLKTKAHACAIAAAPYIHPKLAAMALSNPDGGPVQVALEINFVDPKHP